MTERVFAPRVTLQPPSPFASHRGQAMNRLLVSSLLLFTLPFFACQSTGSESTATATAAVASAPVLHKDAKNVGILIFDGLFITEFSAPFDVYKHAGDKMNVFTVGLTR